MIRPYFVVLALALGMPLATNGGEPVEKEGVGQQTRAALEMQRSGQAASTTDRPMSGDIADRTYQRHAESFSHPIPESFQDEEQEFVKGAN